MLSAIARSGLVRAKESTSSRRSIRVSVCSTAVTVGSGDSVALLEAERGKFGQRQIGLAAFGLVHAQHRAGATFAQGFNDFFIAGVDARATIDHHDHGIAQARGAECLGADLVTEFVFLFAVDTASIDHDITSLTDPANADFRVAGQARHIGHQRIA